MLAAVSASLTLARRSTTTRWLFVSRHHAQYAYRASRTASRRCHLKGERGLHLWWGVGSTARPGELRSSDDAANARAPSFFSSPEETGFRFRQRMGHHSLIPISTKHSSFESRPLLSAAIKRASHSASSHRLVEPASFDVEELPLRLTRELLLLRATSLPSSPSQRLCTNVVHAQSQPSKCTHVSGQL